MDSVDRLLALDGHRLRVFKNKDNLICVEFDRCEVKVGAFLSGAHGTGLSFEDACDSYMEVISGKTLVFDAGSTNEERISVL